MSPQGPRADPAERAFEDFLGRHWPEACRFFLRGLYREWDRRNAEDCAQEAFIKLARRYRDDTATVRAVVWHERATGRPMATGDLATALHCPPEQAATQGQRCVESALLVADDHGDEVAFGGAHLHPADPIVLPLAPLALMRWTTYRHVLADYARRRVAAQNERTDDLAQLLEQGMEPRDTRPAPERAVLDDELHRQIGACLDALARPERTILILHHFYGLSFPEVAETAGIPALIFAGDVTGKSAAQRVQRLKDVAKAGRRQMRRRCPQLAAFLQGDEREDDHA